MTGGCRLIATLRAVHLAVPYLEVRSLPSPGITRLPRYYEPLRHPPWPGADPRGSPVGRPARPPRRASRVALATPCRVPSALTRWNPGGPPVAALVPSQRASPLRLRGG